MIEIAKLIRASFTHFTQWDARDRKGNCYCIKYRDGTLSVHEVDKEDSRRLIHPPVFLAPYKEGGTFKDSYMNLRRLRGELNGRFNLKCDEEYSAIIVIERVSTFRIERSDNSYGWYAWTHEGNRYRIVWNYGRICVWMTPSHGAENQQPVMETEVDPSQDDPHGDPDAAYIRMKKAARHFFSLPPDPPSAIECTIA